MQWVAIIIILQFYSLCLGLDVPVKQHIVNLDLPPDQRWNDVLDHYKDYVPAINKFLSSYVPKEFIPALEYIVGHLDEHLPKPYADELRGIAKHLNISLGMVVIPNIVYDITAFHHPNETQHPRKFCTSIVAQDTNGEIIHGRNLDYPVITDTLKNITANLDFQRGGKTIYTTTSYVGVLGAWTGQKPGVFTVSIDERDTGALWENAIMALIEKASLVSYLVRDVLETAGSYQEAVDRLASTKIIAPVYYIVGGVKPGQGAVITRDREQAKDVWPLDVASGRWFVLETNFDHWEPAGDTRRSDGIKAMDSVGPRHINNATMFKVLSTPQVLNDITTYTTIMTAKYPHMYKAWLRYL